MVYIYIIIYSVSYTYKCRVAPCCLHLNLRDSAARAQDERTQMHMYYPFWDRVGLFTPRPKCPGFTILATFRLASARWSRVCRLTCESLDGGLERKPLCSRRCPR